MTRPLTTDDVAAIAKAVPRELRVVVRPAKAEDPAARKAAVEFLRVLLAQPGKR